MQVEHSLVTHGGGKGCLVHHAFMKGFGQAVKQREVFLCSEGNEGNKFPKDTDLPREAAREVVDVFPLCAGEPLFCYEQMTPKVNLKQ